MDLKSLQERKSRANWENTSELFLMLESPTPVLLRKTIKASGFGVPKSLRDFENLVTPRMLKYIITHLTACLGLFTALLTVRMLTGVTGFGAAVALSAGEYAVIIYFLNTKFLKDGV